MDVTLENDEGIRIKFINEKPDPMTNRISLGGHDEVGYYCVIRSYDLDQVEKIMKETLKALQHLREKNVL